MSKTLTALLAGVAIGILVAPRKGSETRKKIVDGAANIKDDINNFINDMADTLKSGFASAEDEASNIFEKGKEQFSNMGKQQHN